MRLGFGLPTVGSVASPAAIIRVSKRAEELGYDSVWVIDRLLYPVKPQNTLPWNARWLVAGAVQKGSGPPANPELCGREHVTRLIGYERIDNRVSQSPGAGPKPDDHRRPVWWQADRRVRARLVEGTNSTR